MEGSELDCSLMIEHLPSVPEALFRPQENTYHLQYVQRSVRKRGRVAVLDTRNKGR